MEKYIYFYLTMFFVVITPIALYLVLKPMLRQKKLLHGIVNYDTFMRKFVFRIDVTKEEFYSKLKVHNVNDVLEYNFFEEDSVIFTRYNVGFPYKITVDEFKEYIILKVEQLPLVMDKGNVPYLINEFFIKKFAAKPIDYQKFAF